MTKRELTVETIRSAAKKSFVGASIAGIVDYETGFMISLRGPVRVGDLMQFSNELEFPYRDIYIQSHKYHPRSRHAAGDNDFDLIDIIVRDVAKWGATLKLV